MKRRVMFVMLLALIGSSPAFAQDSHFGYQERPRAAMYLLDHEQSVRGTVLQFEFHNPYSILYIETLGENGQPTRWAIEWAPGRWLVRHELRMGMIKPGDQVIVTGHPTRNPEVRMLELKTIAHLTNGWVWRGRLE
jgi:Family of unknown function (DUF6152)